MAVTFTNKAALELRARIDALMDNHVAGLWLGTFHALCVRILRQHAELVGRTPNFTILNTDDQLRLIKQIVKAANLDEKRYPPRQILSKIGRWKDRGLTPDRIPTAEANPALSVYRVYQERLQTLNAADFGDLLLLTLDLFRHHPKVLQFYQKQFRYILVDEYQDTNVAQYLWLRLLTQQTKNICCVGDEDQSIYGWRGAEVTNILRFEQDFAGAKVIRLEQNYRSSQHILCAASGLIAHNNNRLGKTLWTDSGAGEKVKVHIVNDGEEEARLVGGEIENRHRQGKDLSEIAILVRASFQTREFEDRLITLGLPYRVVGGARFYERREIRDALAYLRIVAQPNDSLAFERILNTPRRGLGETTVKALHECAREHNMPLLGAALRLLQDDQLRSKARLSLTQFIRDIERWRQQIAKKKPSELAQIILDESGYTAMWRSDKSPDAPGRLENLKELVRALDEFGTLHGFLEHVSLVMENNQANQSSGVTLMTMHSSKGLEFETVFLAGWEEGLFPHARSLAESSTTGLEEERRLAYVGITRAKKEAIISCACMRRIHGSWQCSSPSRFLDELPKDHIEVSSPIYQSQNYGSYDQTMQEDYIDQDPDFSYPKRIN